jgi:hypothetical protein
VEMFSLIPLTDRTTLDEVVHQCRRLGRVEGGVESIECFLHTFVAHTVSLLQDQ